jgi:serine/threonine protein kinase
LSIFRLLRYFETDEIIYLVLEYVPYGPLFPIVKQYLDRQVAGESSEVNQSDISRELSPFSTSSVIKPSPSFVQLRRNSLQPGKDDNQLVL